MELLERYAALLKLVRAMNEADSWSGETHIQKSVFFLEEGLGAGLGYGFILYKHGPFSFQLRDDLIAMRADEFLELRLRRPDYGPSYVPGKRAALLEAAASTPENLDRRIEFVARRIAPRPVAELEVLATALYVWKERPESSDEALAQRIHELKPHVSVSRASEALRELGAVMEEAESLAR